MVVHQVGAAYHSKRRALVLVTITLLKQVLSRWISELSAIPVDGLRKAIHQRDLGLPAKSCIRIGRICHADPLKWSVRKGTENGRDLSADQADNLLHDRAYGYEST